MKLLVFLSPFLAFPTFLIPMDGVDDDGGPLSSADNTGNRHLSDIKKPFARPEEEHSGTETVTRRPSLRESPIPPDPPPATTKIRGNLRAPALAPLPLPPPTPLLTSPKVSAETKEKRKLGSTGVEPFQGEG